jgi:hypothetical protein
MSQDEPTALAIFDALCELRVRDFVDVTFIGEVTDALAAPGRVAELLTRFVAPVRARVLPRIGDDGARVRDAIPAGVLDMVVAMLPSIPPPPRELVDKVIGSPEVRAEVRRLLDETVREMMKRGPAGRGVIGWGARAATAAGRGVVGAIGGALGADLEGKLSEAVDFGVSLAQARIVKTISSPETARRIGKELAHLLPRLTEVPEAELARMLGRLPHPMIDGLTAALVAHNAGRPSVRAQVDREAAVVLDQLSETTLGELFERFGLRAPLRAVTTRHGARVVALVRARLPAAP